MNALLNSHARESFLVELTDEELFVRACDFDDAGSFEELVRRLRPEYERYFGKRFGLYADALDEALQAAFVRLWSARSSYDPSRAFRPWALRVAFSQVVDFLRARRCDRDVFSLNAPCKSNAGFFEGEDEALSRECDPSIELERLELIDALRRALKRLPACLRQAIELVFYQGMSFQGASKALNVTAGTISRRVAKGAKLLRFYMLESVPCAPRACAAF